MSAASSAAVEYSRFVVVSRDPGFVARMNEIVLDYYSELVDIESIYSIIIPNADETISNFVCLIEVTTPMTIEKIQTTVETYDVKCVSVLGFNNNEENDSMDSATRIVCIAKRTWSYKSSWCYKVGRDMNQHHLARHYKYGCKEALKFLHGKFFNVKEEESSEDERATRYFVVLLRNELDVDQHFVHDFHGVNARFASGKLKTNIFTYFLTYMDAIQKNQHFAIMDQIQFNWPGNFSVHDGLFTWRQCIDNSTKYARAVRTFVQMYEPYKYFAGNHKRVESMKTFLMDLSEGLRFLDLKADLLTNIKNLLRFLATKPRAVETAEKELDAKAEGRYPRRVYLEDSAPDSEDDEMLDILEDDKDMVFRRFKKIERCDEHCLSIFLDLHKIVGGLKQQYCIC
jgi:hypothetical protein